LTLSLAVLNIITFNCEYNAVFKLVSARFLQ